jgi:hypothetical protein
MFLVHFTRLGGDVDVAADGDQVRTCIGKDGDGVVISQVGQHSKPVKSSHLFAVGRHFLFVGAAESAGWHQSVARIGAFCCDCVWPCMIDRQRLTCLHSTGE